MSTHSSRIILILLFILSLRTVAAQDETCTQQSVAHSYAMAISNAMDMQDWYQVNYANSNCPEEIKTFAFSLVNTSVPPGSSASSILPENQAPPADYALESPGTYLYLNGEAIPLVLYRNLDDLPRLPRIPVSQPYVFYWSESASSSALTSINTVAHFTGRIGISYTESGGRIMISAVERESPAWNAGLQFGDMIWAVNGIELGNSLDKAEELLRGEIGTLVSIELMKGTQRISYELIRQPLFPPTITTWPYESWDTTTILLRPDTPLETGLHCVGNGCFLVVTDPTLIPEPCQLNYGQPIEASNPLTSPVEVLPQWPEHAHLTQPVDLTNLNNAPLDWLGSLPRGVVGIAGFLYHIFPGERAVFSTRRSGMENFPIEGNIRGLSIDRAAGISVLVSGHCMSKVTEGQKIGEIIVETIDPHVTIQRNGQYFAVYQVNLDGVSRSMIDTGETVRFGFFTTVEKLNPQEPRLSELVASVPLDMVQDTGRVESIGATDFPIFIVEVAGQPQELLQAFRGGMNRVVDIDDASIETYINIRTAERLEAENPLQRLVTVDLISGVNIREAWHFEFVNPVSSVNLIYWGTQLRTMWNEEQIRNGQTAFGWLEYVEIPMPYDYPYQRLRITGITIRDTSEALGLFIDPGISISAITVSAG